MNPEVATQPVTWTAWYIASRDDIGIILGVVGIFLSIGGFWIAYAQLKKTQKAANAAKAAANRARKLYSRNTVADEAATAVSLVNEVKIYLQMGKFEPALIRAADLSGALIQIQQRFRVSEAAQRVKFTNMLTQVGIIRDLLQKQCIDPGNDLGIAEIFDQLAQVFDELNRLIGIMRVTIEEGSDE